MILVAPGSSVKQSTYSMIIRKSVSGKILRKIVPKWKSSIKTEVTFLREQSDCGIMAITKSLLTTVLSKDSKDLNSY